MECIHLFFALVSISSTTLLIWVQITDFIHSIVDSDKATVCQFISGWRKW